MNKKGLILLLLFTAQLAVPLSMIVQKERILSLGEIVKFEVRPVDPYDPFRGRYLTIGLKNNEVFGDTSRYREDQVVYILLDMDEKGFAIPADLSPDPFDDGLYMKCTVDDVFDDSLTFTPPFNRYYLNEDYAPLAEELYGDDAYVTVRIRKGKAVLKDMYLEGVEINRFIEERLEDSD